MQDILKAGVSEILHLEVSLSWMPVEGSCLFHNSNTQYPAGPTVSMERGEGSNSVCRFWYQLLPGSKEGKFLLLTRLSVSQLKMKFVENTNLRVMRIVPDI